MIRTLATIIVLIYLNSCYPQREAQVHYEWMTVTKIDTLQNRCRVYWKDQNNIEYVDWFVPLEHPFFKGQYMIVLLPR